MIGAFSTYFTFLLKGKNAYLTRKKLCEVYGEDLLTVKKLVFKILFLSTLKMGHVLKVEADEDKIKALIEANWRNCYWIEFTYSFHTKDTTIMRYDYRKEWKLRSIPLFIYYYVE